MRDLIRVTVTVTAYFDDDASDTDRRSERLHQISEAISSAVHAAAGPVRHRIEASSDYIREP